VPVRAGHATRAPRPRASRPSRGCAAPCQNEGEPGRRAGRVHRSRSLKPRITVITLGVDDLERAVAFYRDGLGLATPGIVGTEFEHGAVAFFQLAGGLRMALWPRSSLAHDSGLAVRRPGAPDASIGHNVPRRGDVDTVMAQAERAGARIVKRAHETFWGGYSGYFQDPDGHLWEVTWNPAWEEEFAEEER